MKNKTIEELENLINQNNSDAMYELGKRYFFGKNVKIDYNRAIDYFKKAYNAGNIKGKYGIAKCYYYGRGVLLNYEKAYEIFYELMTKYKDVDATYYIALMYYYGRFVEKNYEKAYKIFYELMINYKDLDATYYIALMHHYGYGVKQDYNKAIEYYQEYLKQKDDPCITYNLGEIYFYGKGVEINYEKALKYFEKSLKEKGNNAYYYLGLIYKTGGYGIEKNEDKSKQYFYNIEKDFCKMLIYYILALYDENYIQKMIEIIDYNREYLNENLNKFPKEHLAKQYFNKLKDLKDNQYIEIAERVRDKIIKFSKQDCLITMDDLESEAAVNIFSEIIIFSNDYESVEIYLNEKIEKHDPEILYLLGSILYNGKDNKIDKQGGLELLNNSAKKGYPYAKLKLAEIKYYQNDLFHAELELKSLLNNKGDENFLNDVRRLLEKIYYDKENKEDNQIREVKNESEIKEKIINFCECVDNKKENCEMELTSSDYLDEADKKEEN